MKYSLADEQQLMNNILQLGDDPEEFALFVYPWGVPGTPLENFKGPRGWARELMQEVKHQVITNRNREVQGLPLEVLKEATASGRGIAKTTTVGMLSHWNMSTHIGSSTIITANTEAQLRTKTMPEVAKWFTLALNSHWFDTSALSIRPAPWFRTIAENELKIDTNYYYVQAQSWSEENPDAFAGAHNHNGMMVVFDEANGIPYPIWHVAEGFFTEPIIHRYWFAFSNPRSNTGAFYQCFHRDRDYWRTRNIDARNVEGTDKGVYDKIINQYGEDSDVARIEVKGQFPRQSANQFIGLDVVEEARRRPLSFNNDEPLIMGVDVARFGSDASVVRFRQGRDARSIKPVRLRGLDNMAVAYAVADLIDKYNPDAVNVDAGQGSGVIDRLRELGYRVNEIWFGARTTPDVEYFNQRTRMWAAVRDWLPGGCIDDDQRLFDDLTTPTYHYAGNDGDKIILESKDDMRARGEASPDDGDALALTFAVPVAKRGRHTSRNGRKNRVAKDVDYDIFG